MSKKNLVLIGLLLPLLYGFSAEEGELRKDVLASDPAFSKVLEKKDKIDKAVADLSGKLDEKESAINKQVRDLKNELAAYRKDINDKIEKHKSALEPERDALTDKIRILEEDINEKNKLYNDLKRTAASIERMIRKNEDNPNLNKDRNQWQERLASLEAQMIPLKSELDQAKMQIAVEKKKLRLISSFSAHLFVEKAGISIRNFFSNLITKDANNEN